MRGQGLRIQLKKIPGVTRGDAAKVLKTPYRFQCPPLENFAFTKGFSHSRYTTYDGTEYTTPAGRTLTTTTFRTLCVEYGGYVVEHDFDVPELVGDLERLVSAGYPVNFLATHQYNKEPELEMDAILESVVVTEEAGEMDARYLDLVITEWRQTTTKRRKLRPSGSTRFVLQLEKDGSYGYTYPTDLNIPIPVTLQGIAKAVYGRPSAAQKIAAAQKPPLTKWGSTAPLIKHKRYAKKGGRILVPSREEIAGFLLKSENTPLRLRK